MEKLIRAMDKRRADTGFGWIMGIYLLGLIVGGLYVGMVAPVRTVIQSEFGIGNAQGIWIITIYALFYASFIPIISKLADRYGRKPIFLGCMTVFCAGSGICGISEWVAISYGAESGSAAAFAIMMCGRVLQAIGACGIIPLANAEIGTSAPVDKRGFALGITAAASGLSNVLGAGVGSAIIGIVGPSNWPILFYACMPFGIIAIIFGALRLPNGEPSSSGKMDIVGSVTIVLLVFSVLMGIQFLSDGGAELIPIHPGAAAAIAFAIAAACIAVMWFAEKHASDPVLDPKFFKSSQILITLAVSFLIGAMINSMTLVPEFAEVSLDMEVGSGGVYMMVIGIFSLAGPPVGGKLIDKYGPKPVLIAGMLVAMAGYLVLAFVTCNFPSMITILIGLAIMGMGLGFCMGAPVNYMMLENVAEEESNSAIGAVTLIRQIGLSIAPALYVAFITTGEGSIGYLPMFVTAAIACLISIVLMSGYRNRKM